MQITLDMGPGFDRVVRELGELGDRLVAAAHGGLALGAKETAGHIVSRYLSGSPLRRRSGLLAKAVDGWMEGPLAAVIGVPEGSPVEKYAWQLGDEQFTIRPKRGRYLAIPIGENLTGAGQARYDSPRDVPGGFFFKSKAGGLFFGIKRGQRGRVRPLFALVTEVLAQGTGALVDGVTERVDDIARTMEEQIGHIKDVE